MCVASCSDSALLFSVDGLASFELPLHLIAQCVAQSRNEVALELHHDDAAGGQQADALVEMRIHIPDQPKRKKDDGQAEGAGSDAEMDEADGEEEDEDADTPAQLFAQLLQVTGDIESTATTPLASFEKLLFSVPRGRYDVDLFPTFLKLASATYTYKIAYKNINKMFLFDAADSAQHLFVIGLNPPVRQGRTAYPYLVVQFDSSEYLEQTFAIDEKQADELSHTHAHSSSITHHKPTTRLISLTTSLIRPLCMRLSGVCSCVSQIRRSDEAVDEGSVVRRGDPRVQGVLEEEGVGTGQVVRVLAGQRCHPVRHTGTQPTLHALRMPSNMRLSPDLICCCCVLK